MKEQFLNTEPKLGLGIYSIRDISSILGLPQKQVRRVLNEIWNKRLLPTGELYSWGEGREKAVNFYTLIEFYTFYQLKSLGLTSKKIIQAHSVLSKLYNTKYPFATSNILTDGEAILFKSLDGLVSADSKLQFKLKEIIEPFFQNVSFNENALAEKLYPKGKNSSIVIDPHHRFGEPVIEDTNISAESILSFYNAGESISTIASLYDISEKQVNDALDFFSLAA